jgi:rhodanese-related sulfurtransferase
MNGDVQPPHEQPRRSDPTADEEPAAILARAAARARAAHLPYAGCVTPAEAWRLQRAGAAALVDVRTDAEWTYVGRVPDAHQVEWRAFRAATPNPRFIEQLREHVQPGRPVMFLCRSGARSDAAARLATSAGWPVSLNVLEGFEGDLDDATGQRGRRGGWRLAGLPWVQS